MPKRPWIVLTSIDPFPLQACGDQCFSKRCGEVEGPHYKAGARWYTPGWGKAANRNRIHVETQADVWRTRGYRMTVTVELL